MKKIIALILLIVFSLSSCDFNGVTSASGSGKPSGSSFKISAQIKKEWRKKEQKFDVTVWFGQWSSYESAVLKIKAPNFAIILPDGTRYEEIYECEYTDFDDEKYKLVWDDEKLEYTIPYFETFALLYIGGDEEWMGEISFSISRITPEDITQDETDELYNSNWTRAHFYYYVGRRYVRITHKYITRLGKELEKITP